MNTFGGYQLVDADFVLTERIRSGAELAGCVGLMEANSLMVPSGANPAHGWILLKRSDFAALNTYNAQSLVIRHQRWENASQSMIWEAAATTFNGLYVISARTPWRGAPSDPLAPYLVEIGDARWLLKNQLSEFPGPAAASFNVRAPAYDGLYNSTTINSGTAWTWAGMAQQVWQMMSLLGTWPGFPGGYTPVGTPEGWIFGGCSAWDALCSILDHLGLVVTCDLTASSNFYGIAHYGDSDAQYQLQVLAAVPYLLEDEQPIFGGAGWVPGTFKCNFHRRNKYFGSEETVRNDSSQWGANLAYVVSSSTGYSGAGTANFWDDFTVRYDESSSPIGADTTTAATVAASRMADYLARITRGANGELRQVYSGIRPFKNGSLVDAVTWKAQPGKQEQGNPGWITEIVRDPWNRWLPKCSPVCGPNAKPQDSSNNQAPVLAPQFPVYPLVEQVVRITSVATGANPFGAGTTIWNGFVQQVRTGTDIRDREACYLLNPNNNVVVAGKVNARLMGAYTNGSAVTLPLYVGNAVATAASIVTVTNITTITVPGTFFLYYDGNNYTLYYYDGTTYIPLDGVDWTYHMDQSDKFYNNSTFQAVWHLVGYHAGSAQGFNSEQAIATTIYVVPFIVPHGGTLDELAGELVVGGSPSYPVSATIANGGTGYTNGDTLTLDGTWTAGGAVLQVASVGGGGVITSVTILVVATVCSLIKPNPIAVSGGTGTGAFFNIVWDTNLVYGIYDSDPTPAVTGSFARYPTTLLYNSRLFPLSDTTDAGLVIDDQTTPLYSPVAPFVFQPKKLYWVAMMSQAGATMRFVSGSAGVESDVMGWQDNGSQTSGRPDGIGISFNSSPGSGLKVGAPSGWNTGHLPTTFPAGATRLEQSGAGDNIPAIGIKFAFT